MKNSLDLLRLVAATLVLYSHQYVLLGFPEPSFLGMTTFGGAGVSIFFFLSGFLVWSSWVRDSDIKRFFIRRSLRIFPGLWLVVFITVFFFGPALSNFSLTDYFTSTETWRYLSTAVLLVRKGLPGVLNGNPFPQAINGSLWTLPIEFLCYLTVAVVGSVQLAQKNWLLGGCLCLVALGATLGPAMVGERFIPHFEMVAFFWWGAWYGHLSRNLSTHSKWDWVLSVLALLVFLTLGSRGVERTSMLLFAGGLVIIARKVSIGAPLTDRLGDLSYGMYIFAFPVQQAFIQLAHDRNWAFETYLASSFLVTAGLAYASWHCIEKRVLLFKPSVKDQA